MSKHRLTIRQISRRPAASLVKLIALSAACPCRGDRFTDALIVRGPEHIHFKLNAVDRDFAHGYTPSLCPGNFARGCECLGGNVELADNGVANRVHIAVDTHDLTACARNAGNLKSYAEFAGVVGILLFRDGLVQPNTEIVCFDTQLLFLANITDELDDLVVLVQVRSVGNCV